MTVEPDIDALLSGETLSWLRLTATRVTDPRLRAAIDTFLPAGPDEAGAAAAEWLRSYDGGAESSTWVLVGRDVVHGFVALSASSVLLARKTRERHGWRYRAQPAILLGWIGRARDCAVGDELWRYAIHQADRARVHAGATVMVVDPLDDASAEFWTSRGFRRASADNTRMWLPLDV